MRSLAGAAACLGNGEEAFTISPFHHLTMLNVSSRLTGQELIRFPRVSLGSNSRKQSPSSDPHPPPGPLREETLKSLQKSSDALRSGASVTVAKWNERLSSPRHLRRKEPIPKFLKQFCPFLLRREQIVVTPRIASLDSHRYSNPP